jgi:3',5'-cyclic AMP phosphodiesterase CpdA
MGGCASSFSYSAASMSQTLLGKPLTLFVASDLHYLSPSLHDDGEAFMNTIQSADGKAMLYSETIIDTLIDETLEAKPDALVLTGDLTFNGEKRSHEELVAKLKSVVGARIPVLVIPGNHDILSPYSESYAGNSISKVENVNPSEFLSLYAPITYSHVEDFERTSFSYLYPLRTDFALVGLSSDAEEESAGKLNDGAFSFLKNTLQKEQEAGVRAFTFSHESLLDQNPLFSSYSLGNAETVASLCSSYGVKANFSGHLHIEHHEEKDGVVDLCSSSLSVSPFSYQKVTITSSAFTYQAQALDVASYAAKKGLKDPNLLSFAEYGRYFFRSSNEKRIRSRLEGSGYSSQDTELLVASYLDLNEGYFAGRKTDESLHQEGFALWRKSSLSFSRYVKSMMEDDQKEEDRYEGTLV